MPVADSNAGSADLELLSALLGIEERARLCATEKALAFLIVNETHLFVPYRQAILLSRTGAVMAVSGIASIDNDVPFLQWLRRNIAGKALHSAGVAELHAHQLPEKEAAHWDKWLPQSLTICPIISPAGDRFGALLIGRREPLDGAAAPLLDRLLACYGHAWSALLGPRKPSWTYTRPVLVAAAILAFIAALGLIHTPITVLAPAEIVAVEPLVVRAPLEGVVNNIAVKPNQNVAVGDLLFRMDSKALEGELGVQKKALETRIAQYKQLTRRALADPKAKAQLPIIAGQAREQEAGIRRLEELVRRATVRADAAGAVIVGNVTDWAGRPARIGERVLMIADPSRVEIEAWLPIADAIKLPQGAAVKLFLNADPLKPLRGRLRLLSYEAKPRPSGVMAHRIRVALAPGQETPRIGLRGTARLSGEAVTLAYWIFRKPLSEVRQFLGL
jgi:hypothetical protein